MNGGLPCNRTTLLIGGPGSGKTLFALGFLAHGVRKLQEPGIFVAFEVEPKSIISSSDGFGWNLSELVRKLASVGIRVGRYVKSGLLRMISARTLTGSAEMLLVLTQASKPPPILSALLFE